MRWVGGRQAVCPVGLGVNCPLCGCQGAKEGERVLPEISILQNMKKSRWFLYTKRTKSDKNYHKTSRKKKTYTYLVIDTETNDTINEEEVTFFDDYIQIEEDKYKFSREVTVKVDGSNVLVEVYDGEPVIGTLLPITYKFSYHFPKHRLFGVKTYYATVGDEIRMTTYKLVRKRQQ